ncbi:recombination protein NinG [Pseudomonas mendocina]|nr:recombination protein NinG [Pseudomonas mendocina]MDV5861380.1 recombination protein NinG [Pseudomonas mendocina]
MTLTAKPKRPKKCRVCRETFTPRKALQVVCSPSCALLHAAKKRERERKALDKIERKAIREAKERVKPRSEYMKEAQSVFNAWVRERDQALPCISCGRHHQGQWHAGHYRTVGSSPELRFEPLNVWKQCAPCNNHKSGDIVNYRIELVRRIGAEQVAWLEGPHEAKRYSIEDLKAITAEYRAKLRELKERA